MLKFLRDLCKVKKIRSIKYRRIHYNKQIELVETCFPIEFSDVNYNIAYRNSVMNNPEYIRMIIYTVDGVQRIVGTYQLIGNDLSSFCILPNYQRRGIATAVLKDILTKVNRISMKGTTEQGCHLYKNFYSYKIGEITYLESI